MRFQLEKILQADLCTGCGLCEAITAGAVQLEMSASGFLRPKQRKPLTTEQTDLLSEVCPAVRIDGRPHLNERHAVWGPVTSMFRSHAVNEKLRFAGSSGGSLTSIAIFLIRTGRVTGIVQSRSDPKNPLLNITQVSSTEAEVLECVGSRYSPAAALQSANIWLDESGPFAFIGKPCEAAALRQYLHRRPALKKKVPYILSFMCAGTPSVLASHKLVRQMGLDPEDIESFKYRGDGWPGSTKAVSKSGKTAELSYEEAWGGVLGKSLQFRCKICPDGTGEFADLTFADGWQTKSGYPTFENLPGISVAIARTSQGDELLTAACAADVISLSRLGVEQLDTMQPYQRDRKSLALPRLIGAALRLRLAPTFLGLGLWRASSRTSATQWVRDLIGSFRRARFISND